MRKHGLEVPPVPGAVKARRPGGRLRGGLGASLLAALFLAACGESGTTGPTPSFGREGEVLIEVRSPLGFPLGGGEYQGTLHETLRWRSDGPWVLAERVSYQGVLGAETIRRSRLNPGELTEEYAALILQLTETPGLRLFGAVSQGLLPICGAGLLVSLPTQLSVSIHDTVRDETVRWVRCTRGRLLATDPLEGIDPVAAGPDEPATRVISAGTVARFYTMGNDFPSTYGGTTPFATLARGENSPAQPSVSRAFLSFDGSVPQDFRDFWELHAGTGAALPEVTWGAEFVVLAAVGERGEAGDSVQVRRILRLPIGSGTRVEVLERVPGDFCSPLAKQTFPFHLVVVPAVAFPIDFLSPQVERIPCGI